MKRLDHGSDISVFENQALALLCLSKYNIHHCPGQLVMARLITGVHDDKKLQGIFLERYAMPRRQIQRRLIGEAIASGELKRGTDTELLIDALNGPLFFRWLQGHAPLEKGFAERIFDKVIPAFQRK